MNTKVWNQLDVEAEKEGEALKRARKNRSAFERSRPGGGGFKAEQAVWDEGLEQQFVECRYCGRTLTERDNENRDKDAELPKKRLSIYGQNADICDGCNFLHGILFRTSASRKT